MNFNYGKVFDINGNTIVNTGGTDVLRLKIARSLYDCARSIGISDQNKINSNFLAEELNGKIIVARTREIFCNVLCYYHLYRDAKRTFDFTSQKENWIRQIYQDIVETILVEMLQATSQIFKKVACRMRHFLQYLINNLDGILDTDCCSHLKTRISNLGEIEENVDKFIVRRMKEWGRKCCIIGFNFVFSVCCHKTNMKQNAFKAFRKPEKVEKKKYLHDIFGGMLNGYMQERLPFTCINQIDHGRGF